MTRRATLFGAVILAAFASACAEDGVADGGTGGAGGGGGATDTAELSLAFADLPELGSDFVYEGWLITGDGPVSTGRFTVDGDGALSESLFAVDATDTDAAGAFVLTIEPAMGG